jgi:predicted kinase
MRTLVLFRGCPGCGKSTFIEYMGWEPYTISPDHIRVMMGSLATNLDGTYSITTKHESAVWDLVFEILKIRFEKGEFTVVDSTNSKTEDMTRLRNLAVEYKYRVFLIDMTTIPKEQVSKQNSIRFPKYKRVAEYVIDRQYARFATQKIPNRITVIPFTTKEDTANRIMDVIQIKPVDLSKYKAIIHVGDIHGCASVLKEAIPEIDPDIFYIFCGDYIDRGIENVEVMKLLREWYKLPNVLLLEGNHEGWLKKYGTTEPIESAVFKYHTQKELLSGGVLPNVAHEIYRKCGQMAYYAFDDKTVLVSHGGIPNSYISVTQPTTEMTNGVGKYEDIVKVIDAFNGTVDGSDIYQVCGHRNPFHLPMQNGNFFLLEDGVEFGGHLRLAILDHTGWHTEQYQNTVYQPREVVAQQREEKATLTEQMRSNRYIQEKKFGDISSFNFSRDAFYKGVWDAQTMRARGLYLNTKTDEVVARGYDKFFNIDERDETSLASLTTTMQYPITVYYKENGYLGLLSYDKNNNDLLFCTKSMIGGEYSEHFKDLFYKLDCDKDVALAKVKDGYTLLFEVIDPEFDPHIISYEKPELCLLDIVKNNMDSHFEDYLAVQQLACRIGCTYKTPATQITSARDLIDFVDGVQNETANLPLDHEGYVLEDANGYRVKLKTPYYLKWKKLRGMLPSIKKHGKLMDTSMLHNPEMIYFYDFARQLYEQDSENQMNILQLRKLFYQEYKDVLNCK